MKDSKGGVETIGYTVEARVDQETLMDGPLRIGTSMITSSWRQVDFLVTTGGAGVPAPKLWKDHLAVAHLLGREQAMALAWWIRAECEARMYVHGVEVRLVPHALKVEWSSSPKEPVAVDFKESEQPENHD